MGRQGSHHLTAAYFVRHGAAAFAATPGHPDIELPEPVRICGRRGDVLLAHYLPGHNIGGNHQSQRTRRALYWRLRVPGHTDHWAGCLTDPRHEYAASGCEPSVTMPPGAARTANPECRRGQRPEHAGTGAAAAITLPVLAGRYIASGVGTG